MSPEERAEIEHAVDVSSWAPLTAEEADLVRRALAPAPTTAAA